MPCALYNVRMSRLIAFVFCLAFLFLAGGWVKVGLVLAGGVGAMLALYVAWLGVRLFIGPQRQP